MIPLLKLEGGQFNGPVYTVQALGCVTAGALLALATSAAPASAGDDTVNLGPVGPREPILVNMGDKRMIASYVPNGGNCFVSAVVFNGTSSDGRFAATRIRVALHPGELFHVDGVEDRPVVLPCGFKGDMLTVLNRTEVTEQAANAASNVGE
jgi:hypothetical protein